MKKIGFFGFFFLLCATFALATNPDYETDDETIEEGGGADTDEQREEKKKKRSGSKGPSVRTACNYCQIKKWKCKRTTLAKPCEWCKTHNLECKTGEPTRRGRKSKYPDAASYETVFSLVPDSVTSSSLKMSTRSYNQVLTTDCKEDRYVNPGEVAILENNSVYRSLFTSIVDDSIVVMIHDMEKKSSFLAHILGNNDIQNFKQFVDDFYRRKQYQTNSQAILSIYYYPSSEGQNQQQQGRIREICEIIGELLTKYHRKYAEMAQPYMITRGKRTDEFDITQNNFIHPQTVIILKNGDIYCAHPFKSCFTLTDYQPTNQTIKNYSQWAEAYRKLHEKARGVGYEREEMIELNLRMSCFLEEMANYTRNLNINPQPNSALIPLYCQGFN